jgi:hypothetical protein
MRKAIWVVCLLGVASVAFAESKGVLGQGEFLLSLKGGGNIVQTYPAHH